MINQVVFEQDKDQLWICSVDFEPEVFTTATTLVYGTGKTKLDSLKDFAVSLQEFIDLQ